MTDREIVQLFRRRDEAAIEQAEQAYALYCSSIASRILSDATDVEECVNDVWLAAWNSIPPNEPERLATYLGKLSRNIAIDRVRASQLGEQAALALISGLSDIVFGYSKGRVVSIDLHDAVNNKKILDPDYLHLAKVLF